MYLLTNEYQKVLDKKNSNQRKLFLEYCAKLIDLKEKDNSIRVEDVANSIVGILLKTDLDDDPNIKNIFDIAANAEIDRELITYAGVWDENYANKLKEKQWRKLLESIKLAKNHM